MAGLYSEPEGLFSVQDGTFRAPAGMFMPNGSQQQDMAIKSALKQDIPSALNPQTPAVKSPLAPLNIGQPFYDRRNRLIGGDLSLSPFLSQPGFSVDMLRNGGMGMV